jgi:hypothetical protein
MLRQVQTPKSPSLLIMFYDLIAFNCVAVAPASMLGHFLELDQDQRLSHFSGQWRHRTMREIIEAL